MFETILIIIFTLFFFWVAWWKLDWAIALTIVFLPTYLLRFQVWFVPMTILEIMLLAVFVVWLIQSLLRKIPIQFPWRFLIALFVLAGVAAIVVSPDTRQALGLWKAYILEPVLFFIAFVNTIKTEQQVRTVIWALGALAVLVGYGTFIQYLGLAPIPEPYGLEIPIRATSVFPFPTAVGKLIGPLLGLFLGLAFVRGTLESEPWRRKMFLWGVIAFSIIALVLSFSRGALIGAFVALIFVSFFSQWKKWLWLGIVGLIVLTLVFPFTRNELVSVFNVRDTSADVHRVLWKGAIRIVKANPITGTGLASFPIVYEKYKEASHTEFFPNPDHLILTLWIEMGLAGLIIFAWLVVKFFRAGCLALRNAQPWQRSLVVGLMAAMVAIIVHGFFDTPYFKNDLAVEFWVLVGLMVLIRRLPTSS